VRPGRSPRALGLLAALLAALVQPPSAGAAPIDFMDYFPNWRQSATHDLVTADGTQRFSFSFPAGPLTSAGGMWGRSLRPCGSDWQMWTPQGLVYFGWLYFCDGLAEVNWLAPPLVGMPRQVDPDAGWHGEFDTVLTHVPYGAGGAIQPPTASVSRVGADLSRDRLPSGESAILLGVRAWNNTEERWWFADCIPVAEGGCAPGVRRILLLDNGAPVLDVSFDRWVPR